MRAIQRTTNVAMIALALVAVVAMSLLIVTPEAYAQIPECCEDFCEASCCYGIGNDGCVRCGEGGCCAYDGNLCEGGQITDCVWCDV